MNPIAKRKLLAFPLVAALLLLVTVAWQLAHSARAAADETQTTAVAQLRAAHQC